eukprot:scaffold77453_cov72-Phaeocystis_antarctica.AAC.8
MSAMVSASTLRGMTRSKSAAIVSSVGASPERGAAGAACGASRSKAWSCCAHGAPAAAAAAVSARRKGSSEQARS